MDEKKYIIRDICKFVLLYAGISLAVALPILLISSIINQITYGDWTCTFKECIVVKGGLENETTK